MRMYLKAADWCRTRLKHLPIHEGISFTCPTMTPASVYAEYRDGDEGVYRITICLSHMEVFNMDATRVPDGRPRIGLMDDYTVALQEALLDGVTACAFGTVSFPGLMSTARYYYGSGSLHAVHAEDLKFGNEESFRLALNTPWTRATKIDGYLPRNPNISKISLRSSGERRQPRA
ncbi:hypothetical protein CC80DRAFT_20566 [Byssothecium circinans]|uniref:Uncharacterized protein n=1 Tax=Byssothecium circinans TaxID=147558 RepID=A0A6A5U1V0_9PLEO|nr:hypothetical protein CC80DRAFT_20566 [Byssothecium circinans]